MTVSIVICIVGFAASAARAADQALPDCSSPHQAISNSSPVVVTVNPATAWQPRGGLVLLEIHAEPALLSGLVLGACLGWSGDQSLTSVKKSVIQNRPSDRQDLINISVEVPDLDPVDRSWPERLWSGEQRTTGLGIVPLATLRIMGVNGSGLVIDTSREIGITSLWYTAATTLLCVILAIAILHALARRRGVLPVVTGSRRLPGQTLFLRLITTSDGHASLSQLQILLWTFVVGASSVYVMCLSGNLINVTNGTLALLGIAGASSLLASAKQSDGAGGQVGQPSWTDLIAPEDGSTGTDVRRVQMLFFTVISAAFVLLKVLTSYVIPDIPYGYLLLMGISNGVYIGGKFT